MLMQTIRGSALALMAVSALSSTASESPMAAKLADFSKVTISVAGRTHIHHSNDYRVTVNADEAVKTKIKIEVDGDTLRIHCTASCNSLNHDSIDIYMPTIAKLTLLNGGKITVGEGFSPVDSIELVIRNGGSIQASALVAQQADAEIYNGGQIALSACNTLDAKIRNGGSMRYRGNPKVDGDVVNGGSINMVNKDELLAGCASSATAAQAPRS